MQEQPRPPSQLFLNFQRFLLLLAAAVNVWETSLRLSDRSLLWVPHALAAIAALGVLAATWPRKRT